MRFRMFPSPFLGYLLLLSTQVLASSPVTVDQAVREALERNLALLAERYNLSVADARIITARLRPNPVLSVGADYQDLLGTGFNSINNAGPAEANLRTDFVLERGGKRQSRIEVAESIRGETQMQLLNSARLLVLDVQSACVEVISAKASLALAQENLKSFRELVEVNTARVNAGDLARVELVRSEVAALQYQNAVLQAQTRLQTARNRLQTLLRRSVKSVEFDVAGEFRRESQSLSIEELRKLALEKRPDLQAMIRDRERALAEVRSQVAQSKPDFTVGTEVHSQYGNATGNSLGFFFSVPLPIFNRNQGEIARARVEQEQVDARLRALQAEVINETEAAFLQYSTARTLLETIERDMLEQAREVRQSTDYSYRRGEASFVELLDAQRAFNDTMQSYTEARAEYARTLYLLDSITGKAVNP